MMNVIRQVELTSGMNALDLTSKEILARIAAAQARSEPTRVTDLVKSRELGTPPTLITKVSHLEEDGWILSTIDPADKRVRRLTLTPKAREAYSAMSDAAMKLFGYQ